MTGKRRARTNPFLMERIEVRNHDVEPEQHLVAIQADIHIAWENRATGHEVTILIAPVDMPVFQTDAAIIGKLVLGADAAVITGQDLGIDAIFSANDFAKKESLLLADTVFA